MSYDQTRGADRPPHRMEIEMVIRIFGDGARPKPPWLLQPQGEQDFGLALALVLHDRHQEGVGPVYDAAGFLLEWQGFRLRSDPGRSTVSTV